MNTNAGPNPTSDQAGGATSDMRYLAEAHCFVSRHIFLSNFGVSSVIPPGWLRSRGQNRQQPSK